MARSNPHKPKRTMPDPRYATRRGAGHHLSKLDDECVYEIKQRLLAGDTTRDIAKDYGVAAETISKIKRGVTWLHVPWT
jgi:hypothetical protein